MYADDICLMAPSASVEKNIYLGTNDKHGDVEMLIQLRLLYMRSIKYYACFIFVQ